MTSVAMAFPPEVKSVILLGMAAATAHGRA